MANRNPSPRTRFKPNDERTRDASRQGVAAQRAPRELIDPRIREAFETFGPEAAHLLIAAARNGDMLALRSILDRIAPFQLFTDTTVREAFDALAERVAELEAELEATRHAAA